MYRARQTTFTHNGEVAVLQGMADQRLLLLQLAEDITLGRLAH